MRWLKALVVLAAAAGLGGCFVAEDWLIAPADAAFPFETVKVKATDSNEVVTLTHRGDGYMAFEEDEAVIYRFQHIRDDYYLVQLGSVDPAETGTLLGLLRFDLEAATIDLYKIYGQPEDAGPGLEQCDEDICVRSLPAYLDHALAYAESGEPPQGQFTILSAE